MQVITNSSAEIGYKGFQEPVRRWFALRTEGGLPTLEQYIAEEDKLADYRMVAIFQHDPLSVFYKEAGETLEKLYGRPLAGKNLAELYNDWFRKRAYEGYALMVKEKLPVYEQRTFSVIIGKIGYYKLHLPFGPDGKVESGITYIMPTNLKFKKRLDWEKIVKKTPWLHD